MKHNEDIFDDYMETIRNKIKDRPKGLKTKVENYECLLLLDGIINYITDNIQEVRSIARLKCGNKNPFVLRNSLAHNLTIPIQHESRKRIEMIKGGYLDYYIDFPSILIFESTLNQRPSFLKLQEKCKALGFKAFFKWKQGEGGYWDLIIDYKSKYSERSKNN